MPLPDLPLLQATGALPFAFEHATFEGKLTLAALALLSFFSWSIILSKLRQLQVASRRSRQFLDTYEAAGDPLALPRESPELEAAPAFQVYRRAAREIDRLLAAGEAPRGARRLSPPAFESVKAVLEEASGAEAIHLERGMTVLSTAVAGGPFIGLLGTVWGVMETFAGIARANAATLTAMAPGVAGALIATVAGLLVAIPAMFAYNYMVGKIRHLTQELDAFANRFAAQASLACVEQQPPAP